MFYVSSNFPLREYSEEKGNCIKLEFSIDNKDEDLKKYFAGMAGNAKYTSPLMQNDEFLAIANIANNMVVQGNITEPTNLLCQ